MLYWMQYFLLPSGQTTCLWMRTFVPVSILQQKRLNSVARRLYQNKRAPKTVFMMSGMSRVSFVNLQCTSYRSNSTEQIPSWEANLFSISQETSRILRNPKVHYRIYKRLPPVPIKYFILLCVILTRPCTFLGVNTLSWSRGSSVSIVTRLRAAQPRN